MPSETIDLDKCPGCNATNGALNFNKGNFYWCKNCGVIVVEYDGIATCHVPRLAPNKVQVFDDYARQLVGLCDS